MIGFIKVIRYIHYTQNNGNHYTNNSENTTGFMSTHETNYTYYYANKSYYGNYKQHSIFTLLFYLALPIHFL